MSAVRSRRRVYGPEARMPLFAHILELRNRLAVSALAMLLIFGVSFEFPLVVVLLNFMGVLSYRRLRSWWRPMVLGIFVFAAVATPSQDPFTMSALAVPMTVLYWVAVGVAYLHDKRKARREAASPYAGLSDDEASPLEPAF